MPARAIAPEPASPAQIPSSRRTDQLPLAVLGLGLLITTGIILQNILFNRRYHKQAELALLDDLADALVARGVPFVLCTGYAREDGDEAAIRNAPRLTKPFNMQSLRAAMDDAFGRDRA